MPAFLVAVAVWGVNLFQTNDSFLSAFGSGHFGQQAQVLASATPRSVSKQPHPTSPVFQKSNSVLTTF